MDTFAAFKILHNKKDNFSCSFPRRNVNLGRSCIFVMMSNLIATLISLIECLITFTMLINKDAYMVHTGVPSILGTCLYLIVIPVMQAEAGG